MEFFCSVLNLKHTKYIPMNKFLFALTVGTAVFFVGCDKDDDDDNNDTNTTSTMSVTLSGLEDLGSDYVYEGWIMVNGSPVSTGTFTVGTDGSYTESVTLDSDQLSSATAYVLSIEPSNDPDPAPSAVKILAGDFSGSGASLSVGHTAALGNDLPPALASTFWLPPPMVAI